MLDDIELALHKHGKQPADIPPALDFGCGCARLIIAAIPRWQEVAWSGCDIDEAAIDWCSKNWPEAQFLVNNPNPPLPYTSETFDFVYCGSVFTHLNEEHQDIWLAEMRRVLKPSGLLFASVLGSRIWEKVPAATVRTIKKQGFLYSRTEPNQWIRPEWYQTAWHTETYIRNHWSQFLEFRGYFDTGLKTSHAMVLLQRTE